MLGKIDNWRLCIGGSHRLAHTLWRQMRRNNVTLRMASPVEEILLDNGRAAGARTSDGKCFYADKLVASSLDLHQTFAKMLPPGSLPETIQKDIDGYEYQDGTLFSVHMAMNKIPTYKAAAFDPDINQAWVLNIGYECLEDFNNDWKDIRSGKVPEDPKLNVAINSLFDPTDAPEGKATGVIRAIAPYAVDGKGPGIWASKFKDVYSHRCIRKLEKYCDNFTAADIIQAKPYTPLDISEKLVNMRNGDWMVGRICEDNLMGNRPTPLMSQYKTPIKGLYLCGSTTHPHGFITFGPGYNALQVIADDFGMDKWWVEI
jgi:phytoene dehydrogenase-like protein